MNQVNFSSEIAKIMNQESRNCQHCKEIFVIEPADFAFYEKMQVPPPTFCPECRLIQRLSWRNERTLHQNVCGLCGDTMLSVFAKDSDYVVYCAPCWWSDTWDGLDYGMEFDENTPFISQLNQLFHRVPLSNFFGLYPTLVNSPYVNMGSRMKDCYFLTHSMLNENSAYGASITNTKDSYDNLLLDQGELCYDCVNCQRCYQTTNSVDCENCHNVYFSKNLIGCSNCIGCVNLRNKQHCIFNKQYSKEEYERQVEEFVLASFEKRNELAQKAYQFWTQFPQKFMHEGHNLEVSGDYIYNSKNTFHSYIGSDMEDSKFCAYITPGGAKNCYDMTHYASRSELLYNCLQVGDQAARVVSTWYSTTGIQEIEHSMFIIGGNNIFGCVGLKKQKYCILNKQYSKEDYKTIREKIIKQMDSMSHKDSRGRIYQYADFFPTEMSPFGYNETTAQEFFSLSKDQAQEEGYHWREITKNTPSITLKELQLPDTIERIDETIVSEIIECAHKAACQEQCSGAFRIIAQELSFYKKMALPLPRLCPNCRHYQRLQRKNSIILRKMQCNCKGVAAQNNRYKNIIDHVHGSDICPNISETTYPETKESIVYCEQCYLSELI